MEDKYKSLTAPELAAEDAFIRWVIKGENDPQWNLWQLHNPQQAESVAEAKQMIRSINFPIEHISAQETNELWNRINSTIHQQSNPPSRKTYSIVRWSLAAAATLALIIWVSSAGQMVEVMAHSGENKEIFLPESSHVILNAGSKIVYHENNFIADRELKLDGEAFFEVKPGSQFTIKTDHGTISVLGTSFNVISRPGRFEVSCHTGKVSVKTNKNDSLMVTARERVYVEPGGLKKVTFASSEKPDWTKGKFTFENQPLSVVIGELERQYNVTVDLKKELQDVRYTGLFEAGNLDTALYTITWPLNLQYGISGKTVTISR